MDTSCAPLVSDLFLFYYEREIMVFPLDDKQADIIDACNTTCTSKHFNDTLNINNINNIYFTYPSEPQRNKANTSYTEDSVLDLHLSISNDIVFNNIYDKLDDFDFEIVHFSFLDGSVPRSSSYRGK